MLRGLKKTKPTTEENQPNRIRSVVNEGALKNQVMMEQGQEERPDGDQLISQTQKQLDHKYQECYDLFLGGQNEELEQRLTSLKSEVQSRHQVEQSQAVIKPKGKFEYDIKFDQDDQKAKQTLKKRNRPIMASNRVNQYCIYCPDNDQLQLLSASNYVYLALAKRKTFKNYYHFILAPVDHEQTMIGLNEDILTEISNFKKCLLQAFDKINATVVFFEQFSQNNSHIYVQCLVVSYNKGQDMPFFFKQALEDVEGNWNTHKNIIKIQKEKGGLQKQIPRAIKYFYIDFSNGFGYAHVIQNEKFWKRQFCYQVLATALGLETHQVKTTEQFNQEEILQKRERFTKLWEPFDWTKLI